MLLCSQQNFPCVPVFRFRCSVCFLIYQKHSFCSHVPSFIFLQFSCSRSELILNSLLLVPNNFMQESILIYGHVPLFPETPGEPQNQPLHQPEYVPRTTSEPKGAKRSKTTGNGTGQSEQNNGREARKKAGREME